MADIKPKYHSDTWLENDDVTINAKRVKLYGYETAATTWRPVAVNSDGELITGVNLVEQQMSFYSVGDAIVNNLIVDGIYFKNDVKITKIGIFVDIAPTGANLIIDQTIAGAVQSKAATLTAGSQYAETDITDLAVLTTDRYGLKITQIGSTLPGSNIKIIIHYTKA